MRRSRLVGGGIGRRGCVVVLLVLAALTLASAALAHTDFRVDQPDFQLTLSPPTQQLQPGSFVDYAVGLGSIGGFADSVDLSVSGLPAGVTGVFSPSAVTPPGTSFLRLTAVATAATGTFGFTITAVGGGITHVANGLAKVDFGLVPVCTGSVHGVVTDSETHLPIDGAEVGIGGTTMNTGTDGSYSIDQIPLGENNSPQEVEVRAAKDPPVLVQLGTYWSAIRNIVIACNEPQQVDLPLVRAQPASISGRVLVGNPDPSDYSHVIPTTTPIEGATVFVGEGFLAGPFTTLSDGRYDLSFHVGENNAPIDTFLGPVDVPNLPLRHGYWQAHSPFSAGPGDHVVKDIALVQQCTASISGRAIYANTGLPAANIEVDAGNGPSTDGAATQTNANGVFSFPELLLGFNNQPTTLGVTAQPTGFFAASAVSDTLGCGDHAGVQLLLQPLQPNFAVVTGVVTDETGAALADATVQVFCQTQDPQATCNTQTDSVGRYTLDHVPVSGDGSSTSATLPTDVGKDGFYAVHDQIDVTAGATTVRDFVLLHKKFGRLIGVVRDSITGAPIPNAASAECHASSDQTGAYDTGPLDLPYPNAPTDLSCTWLAPGYWFAAEPPIAVQADVTSHQDVELLPICDGATITGRVVDVTTQLPIQGATVSSGNSAPSTTDANGNYRLENVTVGFDNSPLDVGVTASAPGYYTQTKAVTVFCGGAVILDFGRQTTPGRIVVVKRTVPASDQSFGFERNWGASFTLHDAQSLDSGDLAPGSGYSVSESSPLPAGWVQTSASCDDGSSVTNIDVAPGETVTCTFTNRFGNEPPPPVVHVAKSCPGGPAAAGDRFQLTVDGSPVGPPLACGGSADVTVAAGSAYAVDETAAGSTDLSVYDRQASAGCSGTLTSGHEADCLLTNALKPAPVVHVSKLCPNGPSATGDRFQPTLNGQPAGGPLACGDSADVTVAAGTAYAIGEAAAGTADLGAYDRQASAGCAGTLMRGQSAVCSLTNALRPAPVVHATKLCPGGPAAAGDRFQLTLNGQSSGDPLACGGSADVPVAAGSAYAIGETAAGTTDLTAYDAQSSSGCGGTLARGQTADCTITNTLRPGRVSVRKTVSGQPLTSSLPLGQQSFTFQLRQQASTTAAGTLLEQADANVANGGVVGFATALAPNNPYQLCEVVLAGWTTSLPTAFGLFGTSNVVCTSFTVAVGEQRTISVDNQPPAAPGTGVPLTIGFWKSWSSCSGSSGGQSPRLDQTLAGAQPAGVVLGTLALHGSVSTPNVAPDCLKAVRILDKSTIDAGKKLASDPAFNLAAQLLAAKLNFLSGAKTCAAANGAVTGGQALLAAAHFNGITHDPLTAAQSTQANSFAATLDGYNNGLLC